MSALHSNRNAQLLYQNANQMQYGPQNGQELYFQEQQRQSLLQNTNSAAILNMQSNQQTLPGVAQQAQGMLPTMQTINGYTAMNGSNSNGSQLRQTYSIPPQMNNNAGAAGIQIPVNGQMNIISNPNRTLHHRPQTVRNSYTLQNSSLAYDEMYATYQNHNNNSSRNSLVANQVPSNGGIQYQTNSGNTQLQNQAQNRGMAQTHQQSLQQQSVGRKQNGNQHKIDHLRDEVIEVIGLAKLQGGVSSEQSATKNHSATTSRVQNEQAQASGNGAAPSLASLTGHFRVPVTPKPSTGKKMPFAKKRISQSSSKMTQMPPSPTTGGITPDFWEYVNSPAVHCQDEEEEQDDPANNPFWVCDPETWQQEQEKQKSNSRRSMVGSELVGRNVLPMRSQGDILVVSLASLSQRSTVYAGRHVVSKRVVYPVDDDVTSVTTICSGTQMISACSNGTQRPTGSVGNVGTSRPQQNYVSVAGTSHSAATSVIRIPEPTVAEDDDFAMPKIISCYSLNTQDKDMPHLAPAVAKDVDAGKLSGPGTSNALNKSKIGNKKVPLVKFIPVLPHRKRGRKSKLASKTIVSDESLARTIAKTKVMLDWREGHSEVAGRDTATTRPHSTSPHTTSPLLTEQMSKRSRHISTELYNTKQQNSRTRGGKTHKSPKPSMTTRRSTVETSPLADWINSTQLSSPSLEVVSSPVQQGLLPGALAPTTKCSVVTLNKVDDMCQKTGVIACSDSMSHPLAGAAQNTACVSHSASYVSSVIVSRRSSSHRLPPRYKSSLPNRSGSRKTSSPSQEICYNPVTHAKESRKQLNPQRSRASSHDSPLRQAMASPTSLHGNGHRTSLPISISLPQYPGSSKVVPSNVSVISSSGTRSSTASGNGPLDCTKLKTKPNLSKLKATQEKEVQEMPLNLKCPLPDTPLDYSMKTLKQKEKEERRAGTANGSLKQPQTAQEQSGLVRQQNLSGKIPNADDPSYTAPEQEAPLALVRSCRQSSEKSEDVQVLTSAPSSITQDSSESEFPFQRHSDLRNDSCEEYFSMDSSESAETDCSQAEDEAMVKSLERVINVVESPQKQDVPKSPAIPVFSEHIITDIPDTFNLQTLCCVALSRYCAENNIAESPANCVGGNGNNSLAIPSGDFTQSPIKDTDGVSDAVSSTLASVGHPPVLDGASESKGLVSNEHSASSIPCDIEEIVPNAPTCPTANDSCASVGSVAIVPSATTLPSQDDTGASAAPSSDGVIVTTATSCLRQSGASSEAVYFDLPAPTGASCELPEALISRPSPTVLDAYSDISDFENDDHQHHAATPGTEEAPTKVSHETSQDDIPQPAEGEKKEADISSSEERMISILLVPDLPREKNTSGESSVDHRKSLMVEQVESAEDESAPAVLMEVPRSMPSCTPVASVTPYQAPPGPATGRMGSTPVPSLAITVPASPKLAPKVASHKKSKACTELKSVTLSIALTPERVQKIKEIESKRKMEIAEIPFSTAEQLEKKNKSSDPKTDIVSEEPESEPMKNVQHKFSELKTNATDSALGASENKNKEGLDSNKNQPEQSSETSTDIPLGARTSNGEAELQQTKDGEAENSEDFAKTLVAQAQSTTAVKMVVESMHRDQQLTTFKEALDSSDQSYLSDQSECPLVIDESQSSQESPRGRPKKRKLTSQREESGHDEATESVEKSRELPGPEFNNSSDTNDDESDEKQNESTPIQDSVQDMAYSNLTDVGNECLAEDLVIKLTLDSCEEVSTEAKLNVTKTKRVAEVTQDGQRMTNSEGVIPEKVQCKESETLDSSEDSRKEAREDFTKIKQVTRCTTDSKGYMVEKVQSEQTVMEVTKCLTEVKQIDRLLQERNSRSSSPSLETTVNIRRLNSTEMQDNFSIINDNRVISIRPESLDAVMEAKKKRMSIRAKADNIFAALSDVSPMISEGDSLCANKENLEGVVVTAIETELDDTDVLQLGQSDTTGNSDDVLTEAENKEELMEKVGASVTAEVAAGIMKETDASVLSQNCSIDTGNISLVESEKAGAPRESGVVVSSQNPSIDIGDFDISQTIPQQPVRRDSQESLDVQEECCDEYDNMCLNESLNGSQTSQQNKGHDDDCASQRTEDVPQSDACPPTATEKAGGGDKEPGSPSVNVQSGSGSEASVIVQNGPACEGSKNSENLPATFTQVGTPTSSVSSVMHNPDAHDMSSEREMLDGDENLGSHLTISDIAAIKKERMSNDSDSTPFKRKTPRKLGYNTNASLESSDIKIKRRKLVKKSDETTEKKAKPTKISPKKAAQSYILLSDSGDSSDETDVIRTKPKKTFKPPKRPPVVPKQTMPSFRDEVNKRIKSEKREPESIGLASALGLASSELPLMTSPSQITAQVTLALSGAVYTPLTAIKQASEPLVPVEPFLDTTLVSPTSLNGIATPGLGCEIQHVASEKTKQDGLAVPGPGREMHRITSEKTEQPALVPLADHPVPEPLSSRDDPAQHRSPAPADVSTPVISPASMSNVNNSNNFVFTTTDDVPVVSLKVAKVSPAQTPSFDHHPPISHQDADMPLNVAKPNFLSKSLESFAPLDGAEDKSVAVASGMVETPDSMANGDGDMPQDNSSGESEVVAPIILKLKTFSKVVGNERRETDERKKKSRKGSKVKITSSLISKKRHRSMSATDSGRRGIKKIRIQSSIFGTKISKSPIKKSLKKQQDWANFVGGMGESNQVSNELKKTKRKMEEINTTDEIQQKHRKSDQEEDSLKALVDKIIAASPSKGVRKPLLVEPDLGEHSSTGADTSPIQEQRRSPITPSISPIAHAKTTSSPIPFPPSNTCVTQSPSPPVTKSPPPLVPKPPSPQQTKAPKRFGNKPAWAEATASNSNTKTARMGKWRMKKIPPVPKHPAPLMPLFQQERISKAAMEESIYLTMQKLLNGALILDQRPNRMYQQQQQPAWPMRFETTVKAEQRIPRPLGPLAPPPPLLLSPTSRFSSSGTVTTKHGKVTWFCREKVVLKPCFVKITKTRIKSKTIKVHRCR